MADDWRNSNYLSKIWKDREKGGRSINILMDRESRQRRKKINVFESWYLNQIVRMQHHYQIGKVWLKCLDS